MIDFLPFLKILPALLVALMSPGPSFLMVSNLSLAKGRTAGVQCAAGMGTADFIYAALCVLGLGLLFEKITILMIILKILGGLYLIYIGVQMWRSTFIKKQTPQPALQPQSIKQKNSYRLGLLTNLTNPKVMVFYSSIFTLALEHGANAATQTALPFLCGLTAFSWFCFVALALSVPRIRTRYQKWSMVIDRVAGTVLVFFGLKLALSGKV